MAVAHIVRSSLDGRSTGRYFDIQDTFAMLSDAHTQALDKERRHEMIVMAPQEPPFKYQPHLKRYLESPVNYVRRSRGKVDVVVVGTVVVHALAGSTKALVVQRSRHDYMGSLWEVPGGSCDDDDRSILEAAARELHEEAGLTVSEVLDVVEDDHEWFDHGKTWRKMTFLVEVVAPNTAPDVVDISRMDNTTTPAQMRHDATEKITTTTISCHELSTNITTNERHAPSELLPRYSSYCDETDSAALVVSGDVPQVTLDPNEHEDFVWASEDEVLADFCSGRALHWTTPEQKAAILRAFDMMKSRGDKCTA